jgi:hypothetical protein
MKDEISLRIQNNTNLPQRVSLMGGSQDPNDNANVPTLITWTFSSFAGAGRVEIQSKTISQVNYQTYSAPISSPTIEATVEALNTLQIGDFSETSGIIYTSSGVNQYRNLALTTATYNFDDFMIQAQNFFDPANSFFTFTGVSFISFYSDTFFNALYKVQGVMDAYFTYGMGVFYPISGDQLSAPALSSVSMTPSIPKPPLSEPITIYDNGVNVVNTAGYGAVPTNNVTNVILFAPSGDFLEVDSLVVNGIPYYVSYFDTAYWNLSQWFTNAESAKITRIYNSGYITSMINLVRMDSDNTLGGLHAPIVYKDGALFPNISSNSLNIVGSLNNNVSFSAPTTANDFNVGLIPNIQFVTFSGYGTLAAPVNLNLGLTDVGFNIRSFQLNGMGINVIDAPFNTYFSTRVDQAASNTVLVLQSPNYDSQLQDTVTPINTGDFISVIINMKLTSFPPIAKIGNQNIGLLQYRLGILDLTANRFPSAIVNQILIDMDSYITTLIGLGYVFIPVGVPNLKIDISNQTPPAPPFGAGIIAKNNLIANGFTVITD